MDAPPTRSSENLGNLWQGSSRPLRLQRQLSLPNMFYQEHGCPGPWMAQPSTICFPPSRSATQVLSRVREQRHKLILIATLEARTGGHSGSADAKGHSGSADAGGCSGSVDVGGALWKCGAGRDQRRRRKAGWYQQWRRMVHARSRLGVRWAGVMGRASAETGQRDWNSSFSTTLKFDPFRNKSRLIN